jgi:hypothetical protein
MSLGEDGGFGGFGADDGLHGGGAFADDGGGGGGGFSDDGDRRGQLDAAAAYGQRRQAAAEAAGTGVAAGFELPVSGLGAHGGDDASYYSHDNSESDSAYYSDLHG